MRTRLCLVLAAVAALAACKSETPVAKKQPTAPPPPAQITSTMTVGSAASATTATSAAAPASSDKNLLGLKRPAYDKSNPNWKFGVQDPGTATFDPRKDYFATLHTTLGDITVKFFPDVAPHHATAFINLSELGYYDNAPFHRIIPGFMMQGGDPTGQGNAGPLYHLGREFSSRKHLRGSLAAARVGADMGGVKAEDSAGSQFYICFQPSSFLDGKYTVFGEVTKGMEVVDKFEKIGSRSGHPSSMEKITSVDVFTKSKG